MRSRQCFPIIESVSFVSKPVVLIAEELSPATMDALGTDFEIRHTDGSDRDQLLPALAEAEAVLIRSATTMDAEAIGAAKNLKVTHVLALAWITLTHKPLPKPGSGG